MLKFTSVGVERSVHLEINVSCIVRGIVHAHVIAGIVALIRFALPLIR